jgi:hypothetical protein
MRLIRLVVILALSLALAPLAVGAQQVGKVYRVGVLASSTESNFAPSVRIFREALYAAGWVEGRNLTLDVRYPGDQHARQTASYEVPSRATCQSSSQRSSS